MDVLTTKTSHLTFPIDRALPAPYESALQIVTHFWMPDKQCMLPMHEY